MRLTDRTIAGKNGRQETQGKEAEELREAKSEKEIHRGGERRRGR